MNTSAKSLYSESKYLVDDSAFIEIQSHDKLKIKKDLFYEYKVSDSFYGFFTLHGEGETDGSRRIFFCSDEKDVRERYVRESTNLYNSFIDILHPCKIKRIIVHPDTLVGTSTRSKKSYRPKQVGLECNFLCYEKISVLRHSKI